MTASNPIMRFSAFFILGIFLLATDLYASDAGPLSEAPRFLRLTDDAAGEPAAMQVSIVRYAPGDAEGNGLFVDLISAVHVGDAAYYADLNERFETYDAVLFELVLSTDEQPADSSDMPEASLSENDSMDAVSEPDADEDSNEDTDEPAANTANEISFNLISMFQGGMKNALGLSYQLEEIDYGADNMVHADMTLDEFNASMQERGESMFKTFMKLWRAGMRESLTRPPSASDFDIFRAWFARDRERALKQVMAREFVDTEMLEAALSAGDGSTLLTERNKKALQVLRDELDLGRQKIAIFYGAAHMPDIGQRLIDEFGLVPVGIEWVDAWDLSEQ